MAEAAMASLMEQVEEVVKEYKDLITGAENEFNHLNNDLAQLKALLNEAKKREQKHIFREMEKQIRDVVYEVEGTIDTCLSKAIQTKAKKFRSPRFGSSSKTISIAKEVEYIRHEKLLPALKLASDGFPAVDDTRAILIRTEQKHNFMEMKKQKQKLICDFVFEGPIDTCLSNKSLTPRCGPSSKTISIAKEVESIRKDDKVKQVDLATMFISDGLTVSVVADPRIAKKMSKAVLQSRKVCLEEEIIGYLMQENEKLGVIIINDIGGQEKTALAWKILQNENISYHFPTRISITIAEISNNRDVFHQILTKFMPGQDISNLTDEELADTVRLCLKKEKFLLVLDDVWSVVDALKKIKQVLPLDNGESKVFITSRDKNFKGLLSTVYRNLHVKIVITQTKIEDVAIQLKTRVDVATKERESVSMNMIEVFPTFKYDRLPDDLKVCFVYLGVFPKDYEIPVKLLCRLWISEGFIQAVDDRTLEETAQENLNVLIKRNLLMVEKTNRMGKVKTCRVHDTTRRFCISQGKELDLFQEITPPVSEVQELYGLSLNSDLSKFLSECSTGPRVRTFLCFEKQTLEKQEHIAAILDGFQKLRILEFNSIKLSNFPSKFMQLIHLRYLTLYIEALKILPEAISELWNLQSLAVETGSHSITMKANIWKMIRLRHLNTNAELVLDTSKWEEGEAGKNLQTLNRLSPESCTEAVSAKAKNLKTLCVYGKLAHAFGTKFLEQLHRLEKLKLVNSLVYEATPEDLLHILPQPYCFPPNLKRLTLMNTFLDWKLVSTLATIRSLEVLKLKDNAFVGVSWNANGYNFPNLQLLLIVNTDLVHWEASADTFPSLRYLVVENCEKLEEIPECMGTHLEKLEIERLRHSAVLSAQKNAETKEGKPESKFAVQFKLIIGPACETK